MSGRISPQIIRPGGWSPNNSERFVCNRGSDQARGLLAWYPFTPQSGTRLIDLAGSNSVSASTNRPGYSLLNGLPAVYPYNGSLPAYWTLPDFFNGSFTDASLSVWVMNGQTTATSGAPFKLTADGSDSHYPLAGTTDSGTVYINSLRATRVSFHVSGMMKPHLITITTTPGANGWKFYKNGVVINTQTGDASISLSDSAKRRLGTSWGSGQPYLGFITDFRIYNRALTQAEILRMYDPTTRYDLYYPLGRRLWFIPGAAVTPLSLSGSITPAGALVKQDSKAISGAVTPAGAATKQANKSASGSVAPSGSVVRSFASALAGALTPSGALAKVFSSTLSGSITPSGTLDALRTALLSLAGSLGLSGALARRSDKGLSGSVTPAGGLAKRIGKLLSGAIAAAGALVTSLTTTNQKITCTLSDEAVTVASVTDELGG